MEHSKSFSQLEILIIILTKCNSAAAAAVVVATARTDIVYQFQLKFDSKRWERGFQLTQRTGKIDESHPDGAGQGAGATNQAKQNFPLYLWCFPL